MERRREKRLRRRFPCDLWAEGRWHCAVVLNLSSRGLFVQTRARPAPGSEVEVRLRAPGQSAPIVLRGIVVRAFVVPPELVVVAGGGIGLQIRSASNAYFPFLSGAARPEHATRSPAVPRPARARRPPSRPAAVDPRPPAERGRPRPPTEPLLRRFRVRVCETDGSRPFTLLIGCASEAEASQEALAELGEGWKVVEVEET